MSYGIQPFAVSIDRITASIEEARRSSGFLRRFFGREHDLVKDIKRQQDGYLLQHDELEDERPVELALRDLIAGTTLDKADGEYHAWALKALCWYLGEFLDNSEWATIRSVWSDYVDHVLAEGGVPEDALSIHRHILYRGAPISIPEPADFPFMGYLSRTEIAPAAAALSQCAVPEANEDARSSIVQIGGWLERAQEKNVDLLFFYH